MKWLSILFFVSGVVVAQPYHPPTPTPTRPPPPPTATPVFTPTPTPTPTPTRTPTVGFGTPTPTPIISMTPPPIPGLPCGPILTLSPSWLLGFRLRSDGVLIWMGNGTPVTVDIGMEDGTKHTFILTEKK